MATVIVSGALANKPGNAGGAWERMSWVLGLQRLGFDVWFVEQIASSECINEGGQRGSLPGSIQLAWFESVTRWFHVEHRSVLIEDDGRSCHRITWSELEKLADSADLLVNLSGHLSIPEICDRIGRKVYVDVDPGFTQFWHQDPSIEFRLEGHHDYFTIAENIGKPECGIPTCGIRWRTVRQPVVLDHWPVASVKSCDRFTTVASWRGAFGPVEANGRKFGLKVHEFRKFIGFPTQVSVPCELALSIDRADECDRLALEQHGWQLVDPHSVAGTPAMFRDYVQQSGAEFSVAQGIYVDTSSGWFSDRTIRYLASGKPVLIQDTGFGNILPVGKGLVSFRAMEEAIDGARSILNDYPEHCTTARAIAEEHFDSDIVLRRFMNEVGVRP
jgi:hypothetical protein